MSALEWVLWFKIGITILLWAGPLLVLPGFAFSRLGFPQPPMLYIRLLGAAYTALVVGYCFGLADLRAGNMPAGVIWMGVVSNGLAAMVLLAHGIAGTWRVWGGLARIYLWASFGLTSIIAVLLAAFGTIN